MTGPPPAPSPPLQPTPGASAIVTAALASAAITTAFSAALATDVSASTLAALASTDSDVAAFRHRPHRPRPHSFAVRAPAASPLASPPRRPHRRDGRALLRTVWSSVLPKCDVMARHNVLPKRAVITHRSCSTFHIPRAPSPYGVATTENGIDSDARAHDC